MKFSDAIRKAVLDDGRSRYAICKAAGISESLMCNFLAGRSGLGMATLDKLAPVLGLVVKVEGKQQKGR